MRIALFTETFLPKTDGITNPIGFSVETVGTLDLEARSSSIAWAPALTLRPLPASLSERQRRPAPAPKRILFLDASLSPIILRPALDECEGNDEWKTPHRHLQTDEPMAGMAEFSPSCHPKPVRYFSQSLLPLAPSVGQQAN